MKVLVLGGGLARTTAAQARELGIGPWAPSWSDLLPPRLTTDG
jgi:hypothetical protein